jgi:hypothetical protein
MDQGGFIGLPWSIHFWTQSLRRLKKKKTGEEGPVVKRLKVKRGEIWISLRKLGRANRIIPTK